MERRGSNMDGRSQHDDEARSRGRAIADAAMNRWYELTREGHAPMTSFDAQLIAQGARERYMAGAYIEVDDDSLRDGDEVSVLVSSVDGTLAEVYSRRAQPGVSSWEDRYHQALAWRCCRDDAWVEAAYDDWGCGVTLSSPGSGAEQWRHEVVVDVRSDRRF